MIDIVRESAYSFLARDPRAVARRYHVIDLDPYGRLQDEIQTELIDSVAAAIAVQTRADVSDWLLLLQTEVASRRSLEGDLQAASAKMLEEHATALERNLSPDTITDDSPPAQLLRYSAGVAATLAECAFPHFVAKLEDRPVFYRGTDEYHVPSRRALMGAFTFRMTRPPLPSGSLGQRARAAKIAPIVDASVKRALRARAVVADEDGDAVVHATLDALNFEGSVGPD